MVVYSVAWLVKRIAICSSYHIPFRNHSHFISALARCTHSANTLDLFAIFVCSCLIRALVKNFKTRCEGLSPALFFFAIFGNTTYALSICAKSMDIDYLITNSGWLAGRDLLWLCEIGPWLMDDTQGVL